MLFSLNYNELYVLNRGLDGKDIYGIPSFKDMSMSDIMINSIKEDLIEKKILYNKDKLTNEGVKILKLIDDYKTSDKIIEINSLKIALTNQNHSVILKIDSGNFNFKLVDIKNIINQLKEVYPLLNIESNNRPEEEMIIKEKYDLVELLIDYQITRNNSFVIIAKSKEGPTSRDIIFFLNESIYRYDANENILFEININYLHNLLDVEVR